MLNGSAHREKGIRDDLQALQVCSMRGDPGCLHLWQGGHVAQAAEDEGRHRVGAASETLNTAPAPDLVVKKHLVHDQGQAMLATEFFDGCAFRGASEVSGWIV